METSHPPSTIDVSKVLVQFFQLLTGNLITLIIALVVSIGAGIFYYWMTPKTYESKMIIQSDILSESYSLKLAENLNTHIRDADIDFLAVRLNLSPDEAGQLKEFKIVSALTPMSQQMAEKDKIIVVISVRVMDNAILPKLQKGVIDYFSNNEYIKKRVDENRKKFEGLIIALDNEIKRLDTLKNKISKGTFANSKSGNVSFMDLSGLYAVAADLYGKKYDFMNDLAVVDSIQIIEGLTPYGKPVWPKLSIILLASLVIAAVIFFSVISFRSLRSQLIKT